jgi:hypothetical protein
MPKVFMDDTSIDVGKERMHHLATGSVRGGAFVASRCW